MNESEILLDTAVLGEQVNQFCKSDVGKYLLAHCQAEIQAGLRDLKHADCNDPKSVWQAQARVNIAESIEEWLREAILAGLKAQEILEDRAE